MRPNLKNYSYSINSSVGLSKDGTTYDDDVKKYIDHVEQQNTELIEKNSRLSYANSNRQLRIEQLIDEFKINKK